MDLAKKKAVWAERRKMQDALVVDLCERIDEWIRDENVGGSNPPEIAGVLDAVRHRLMQRLHAALGQQAVQAPQRPQIVRPVLGRKKGGSA